MSQGWYKLLDLAPTRVYPSLCFAGLPPSHCSCYSTYPECLLFFLSRKPCPESSPKWLQNLTLSDGQGLGFSDSCNPSLRGSQNRKGLPSPTSMLWKWLTRYSVPQPHGDLRTLLSPESVCVCVHVPVSPHSTGMGTELLRADLGSRREGSEGAVAPFFLCCQRVSELWC